MVQADGSLFAFGGVPPTSTMGYDDTTESFKLSTQGPWQLIEGGNMAKVGVVALTKASAYTHTHMLTPPLCCLYTPRRVLHSGLLSLFPVTSIGLVASRTRLCRLAHRLMNRIYRIGS